MIEFKVNYQRIEDFGDEFSNNSRTIIVKSKYNWQKVFGFDVSGVEKGLNSRLPIYYINNFNVNQKESCVTYLGKYGAIVSTTVITGSEKIRCLKTGEIQINTGAFDTNVEPFNIYKNIILGYD